jgi:hypothetical protein
MRPLDGTVEETLAWMATRAHGLVDREELLGAGITAAGIKRRVKKGVLHPR